MRRGVISRTLNSRAVGWLGMLWLGACASDQGTGTIGAGASPTASAAGNGSTREAVAGVTGSGGQLDSGGGVARSEAGAGVTAPEEPGVLADRDYQGIIWQFESYTGYTPPPDQAPSELIYDATQYLTNPHCGGCFDGYTRSGFLFSPEPDGPRCYDIDCGDLASFAPTGLLSAEYTAKVEGDTLTLDGGEDIAVYRSDFTAPVEGAGLTDRTWRLVHSNHPEFPLTQSFDYVMQFEPEGIRDFRVEWACDVPAGYNCIAAGCNAWVGWFNLDGQGAIQFHGESGGYSRPCSLPEGGNPDLDLLDGVLATSRYTLIGQVLTLSWDQPEAYEFVFEG